MTTTTTAAAKRKMLQAAAPAAAAAKKKLEQRKVVIIPNEMILEILMRLPARSVGRFRCVSKSWRSFTTTPFFIKSHTDHILFPHQSLIVHRLAPQTPYLPSKSPRISFHKLPREKMLDGNYILGSCGGLLLFQRPGTNVLRIANLLKGSSINLQINRCYNIFALYFHHSGSEHRLLRVSWSRISDALVIGQRSWRLLPAGIAASFFKRNYSVDVDGGLQWLFWKCSVAFDEIHQFPDPTNVLKIFGEEIELYSLLSLPRLKELRYDAGDLVDLKGELGFVIRQQ